MVKRCWHFHYSNLLLTCCCFGAWKLVPLEGEASPCGNMSVVFVPFLLATETFLSILCETG